MSNKEKKVEAFASGRVDPVLGMQPVTTSVGYSCSIENPDATVHLYMHLGAQSEFNLHLTPDAADHLAKALSTWAGHARNELVFGTRTTLATRRTSVSATKKPELAWHEKRTWGCTTTPHVWHCVETDLYHFADETGTLDEKGYAGQKECETALNAYGEWLKGKA